MKYLKFFEDIKFGSDKFIYEKLEEAFLEFIYNNFDVEISKEELFAINFNKKSVIDIYEAQPMKFLIASEEVSTKL